MAKDAAAISRVAKMRCFGFESPLSQFDALIGPPDSCHSRLTAEGRTRTDRCDAAIAGSRAGCVELVTYPARLWRSTPADGNP